MPLFITPMYGGLLTPYYVLLTIRIIRERIRHRVSLGDGSQQHLVEYIRVLNERPDDKAAHAAAASSVQSKFWPLMVAVRSHGNFIEQTPLVLLLAAFAEYNGLVSAKTLHGLLGAFVVGRVAHVEFGLRGAFGNAHGRRVGVFSSMAALLTFSVVNVRHGWNLVMNA
ncbi:hypothetical protein RI367_003930 [Sorochytrium milnesiophthora]